MLWVNIGYEHSRKPPGPVRLWIFPYEAIYSLMGGSSVLQPISCKWCFADVISLVGFVCIFIAVAARTLFIIIKPTHGKDVPTIVHIPV